MTSKDSNKPISSLESEDGVTHSDLPDGQMRDLFGQVVAPVKVIPSQEKERVQVTPSVTSSPIGSGSSKSVSLQRSLANRLRERFDSGGLMQSQQTLSLRTTPSRRAYCQDLLSEPITNGNGSGSWATPNTMDHLPPRSEEALKRLATTQRKGRRSPANLREQVDPTTMALWTGWPTPTALSGGAGDWKNNPRGDQSGNALKTAASTWPTPSTRDHKGGYEGGRLRNGKVSTDTLDVAAQLTGEQSSGSNAKTEKRDQYRLNPAFSLWLMGYPRSWIERAIPTNTRTQIVLKV